MISNRVVEYVFFFGLMGGVAYIVWQMFAPFVSALALAAVIVTICYPLYERVLTYMPKQNRSLGALVTTFIVLVVVIIPFLFITSSLVSEAVSIYNLVNSDHSIIESKVAAIQSTIHTVAPSFEFNFTQYIQQGAAFLTSSLGSFFAGTASTVFLFFIAMIGTFYFFRDGRELTKTLVIVSPLPDDQDEKILTRLAVAVRSVATGVVLVALIQGSLTAFGLWMLGFERFVLWGTLASFGALIPGVGTSIVLIPAIIYLAATGAFIKMGILIVWGMTAVGLIDNLLGPYLLSRGNKMHPFLMLISVLGGIAFFGPIGFIVGPVMVSLLLVLLELYNTHISASKHT
jgi:predicted PurR-regulated permease PerM